jgi:hypothetical protein
MATDNPTDRGSSDPAPKTTAAEDDRDQAAVLTHVLMLHPTHLKLPDLAREIGAGAAEFAAGDNVERAVRDLVGVGLLYCAGGLVLPTHAAIRCDQLLVG